MIKGLLFDLNGTVIDIYTSECDDRIYHTTANFLDYYHVKISPEMLKEEYFSIMKQQKKNCSEQYPEFDAVKLFGEIIEKYGGKGVKLDPETAACVFRAAGRYKLEPYEGVVSILEKLNACYQMSAISDGQKCWALPELHSTGLAHFFQHVVISSDYGFRKPDPRMFHAALEKMNLAPDEVIFIGNDMYRDIWGAGVLGMKTIFFKSNQGEQNFCGVEPDYIIYNFFQLPEAINFLLNRSSK